MAITLNTQALVSTAAYLSVGALVAWRVYSRIRRMVGRQKLSTRRPWVTLVVFPMLILLLALASLAHPNNLLWLALALSCGAALGVAGLARTRFEATDQGLFYTPNPYIGVALSLLFVARIAYRFVEMFVLAPGVPRSAAEFGRSPLTLAAFGLLAGYYIAYAIGLVRWRARVLQSAPPKSGG